MSLPVSGRLFVGGIAPGTSDADLRCDFSRYGKVADICRPRDRLTGRPRRFAFAQFHRPSDAGRALADPSHVINWRQVYIGRAKPRQSERSSNQMSEYKPLCQRVYRGRNFSYRVGDMGKVSLGTSVFDCVISYISEDGKDCWHVQSSVQCNDKSGNLAKEMLKLREVRSVMLRNLHKPKWFPGTQRTPADADDPFYPTCYCSLYRP
ncbi:hypothetical protein ACP70R_033867 [Stipagrostis hirtigluma subsp. patula]